MPNTRPKQHNSTGLPRITAPPVYRPSATPVVLRKKSALPGKNQPATQSNIKRTPVAPPVYRAQPATKVTQARMATFHNKPASVQASSPPLPKNQTWAGTRTIQRAEEQAVPPVEEPPPPPEEKGDRKQKQAAAMKWDEFVVVTPPAPKHVLEQMKLSDVGPGKLVSVVEKSVMAKAITDIGAHVRAKGWVSGMVGAEQITIEWLDGEKCFKVTYLGNQWKTHVGSGQLWPYCGRDIFSPELAPVRPSPKDLKTYIKNWKGGKGRPPRYMNM